MTKVLGRRCDIAVQQRWSNRSPTHNAGRIKARMIIQAPTDPRPQRPTTFCERNVLPDVIANAGA
jgi:hypothetical protein